MASSTSSLPNGSGRPSPAASLQKPNSLLDTLISHLVASKRSLSSIHHVHRATNILWTARSVLESTTILSARTTYLHRSLTSQLKLLRRVQFELEEVAHNIHGEFSAMLKDLDAAGKRLEDTLQALKDTKVEGGFQTSGLGHDEDNGLAEAKETLHDFLDDKPVEELKDGIKAAIDKIQKAKRDMAQSIQDFEDDLQSINNALGEETTSPSSTRSELKPPNVPALLKAIENNAKEMAESLESLVKHFDLCVIAIKHTEGGGAAVAQNVKVDELPEGVGVEDFEAPPQPLSEDERREMMAVIDNDAAEVDDVVIEIQDRHAEMEAQLEKIQMWKEEKEGLYDDVVNAFKILEQIGLRLTGYVSQSSSFVMRWNEEKAKIEGGMAGLEDLCEIYGNFLTAYDGLIVEVARRKAVKNQMDRVVKDAQSKLAKLYDDDVTERDVFRNDQGEFLPSDIWHGLANPPTKFLISRVDDDSESIPDLPRKTVEEALRRLKAASQPP